MDEKIMRIISELSAEVRELKAMVAQLGPVQYTPPIKVELKALEAQGISLIDHLRSKKQKRNTKGSSK
jgi:hypothetical protein